MIGKLHNYNRNDPVMCCIDGTLHSIMQNTPTQEQPKKVMNRKVQPENLDRSDRLKAINPFLYFCTAMGLLPVKVYITKIGHGNNVVSKAVYRFSMLAFTLTIAMIINMVFVIYLTLKLDIRASFISKLQVKIIFYSDTIMAAINILSLFFYRFQKTLSCLNTATNIFLSLNYYSRLPASHYWILITLASNFVCRLYVHGRTVEQLLSTLVVAVTSLMPYSVLALVVVLNSIIETAYRDINEQLVRFGRRQQYHSDSHRQMLVLWNDKDAIEKQRYRPSVLRELMAKHYTIGDLMLDVCSCFNVDVLAACFNCTMKIIMLTYIWYLHTVYTNSVWRYHAVLMTDVLFLVCIMCITASSCENVTLQYKETEKILLDIMMTEFRTLDENTRYIIEVFLFQIKCRKIEFSVFGIFVLNRALFYDMLSTCVAFMVVLIQFKSK